MTFTSYAQNFEDVILWRALGHVPRGRYIDVGAQDPLLDSVSKGFYEQGWRGFHVEPAPYYAGLLRRDRPDETVLEVALSDRVGLLEFNFIPGTGLSTGIKAQADEHRVHRGLEPETIVVPTMPMKDAFASWNGQDVHWLKIDVEGLEREVLRGWDSAMLRPWILVVESTLPMSQAPAHEPWENIVLEAGYLFAYFDGLNRFYVAKEHERLAAALSTPPNVFDDAQLSGMSGPWCRLVNGKLTEAEKRLLDESARNAEHTSQLQEALAVHTRRSEALERDLLAQLKSANEWHRALEAELRTALADERRQAAQIRLQLTAAKHEADSLRTHLQAVLASTSWRLSAPVRLVGRSVARIRSAAKEGRIRSGIKRRLGTALRAMARFVQARPNVKKAVAASLRLCPPLDRRARSWLAQGPAAQTLGQAPEADIPLDPRAQKIFDQLSALLAIDKRIERDQ